MKYLHLVSRGSENHDIIARDVWGLGKGIYQKEFTGVNSLCKKRKVWEVRDES